MNKISHPSPININSFATLKSFSRRAGFFVIGVGCIVLAGWALDIAVLKSILPGQANMKSNTALLFVLSGISLWMQVQGKARRVAKICAFIIAFAGLLTLGEYLFNSDFGIDQLLFRDGTVGVVHPGRMAPTTALAFILIGLSLMLLDSQPEYSFFNGSLVIIVLMICGLALIGYFYEVSSLYQLGAYTSMAPHAALNFILLSIAILFARPERGWMQAILADTPGGNILRRFLPTAIVAPILLGWMGLWGQRAGLYDTAFGIAIMAISIITTLTIFIWLNARKLTDLDIKRKQMDASLRESDLRFRSTIENMMEGFQIVGYDWRYLFLNDSAVKQSQLTRDQLLGRTMMECYPGIEGSAMFATLRRCMDQRASYHMENEFIFPNGAKGWFELNIQPAPDGISIISTDITRRKQAEAALLQSEMKLSMLFEILPVGISILDAERKVSYTNSAMTTMLDISADDLLKGIYGNRKYLKADGTPMPVEEFASTRAFKEKREIGGVETGVVKGDNSIVWTDMSAVPVDFPDWKVVMVTSDITERKQAETEILKLNAELEVKVAERTASLAEANALLQTLMDHIPDHIYFKDVESRFIRNSKSQIKTLGLSDPAQVIGKTDFDFFPHAQRAFDEEQEIIRSGQPSIDFEESVDWPDGHQTWLSSTKVPLRDQNGQIIGTFGISRDITDRKHAEIALQKANEQLQQLSLFDELTGLYNRRGFMLLAEEQLLLAQRTKRNLLVFYADLDGLKQINDQFGHTAGDEAIITAAHALNETFRTSDIKARLGGDEFIVLAVEAQQRDAQILRARLQKRLARNNQSMSIGVVTFDAQNETSLDDLIAQADEAMYAEKRSKPGRHEM
jgi:diguanylate cyclase (GGDEF)-like protein/PAS domain S-box-containing protein